jgi:hypothetical protein
MVQPNLAPSKPKKKKIPKKPSQKQLAKEKYTKTLNQFKVPLLPHQPPTLVLTVDPRRSTGAEHNWYAVRDTKDKGEKERQEICS